MNEVRVSFKYHLKISIPGKMIYEKDTEKRNHG